MTDHNDSPDPDAPTSESASDDCPPTSITVDDQTILFDVGNADAWIQSDTAVDLADRA